MNPQFKGLEYLRYSYEMPNFLELITEIYDYIIDEHLEAHENFKRTVASTVDVLTNIIKAFLIEKFKREESVLANYTDTMKTKLAFEFYQEIYEHGPISELFFDRSNKTDLHVNGIHEITYRSKETYKIVHTPVKFYNEEHLKRHIDKFLNPIGRNLSRIKRSMSTYLRDRTRITLIYKSVSVGGYTIAFRFPIEKIPTFEENIKSGMISKEMAAFFIICTLYGIPVHFIGEQGTGKTTFLGSFILAHPRDENGYAVDRHVLIGDTPELFLIDRDEKCRVIELHEDTETEYKYTIYDALIDALRLDSNKIHFNEARRGEDFDFYLHSIDKGHTGCSGSHGETLEGVSQSHLDMIKMANPNATDTLACNKILSGIYVYVLFERLKDKNKRVQSRIAFLDSFENARAKFNDIFVYDKNQDEHVFFETVSIPDRVQSKLNGMNLIEMIKEKALEFTPSQSQKEVS